MKGNLKRSLQDALVFKLSHGIFPQANEVLFGQLSGNKFLMGSTPLGFPRLLLDTSATDFGGNSGFVSFKSLSLDQFGVADLFVLLLLDTLIVELVLLKHLHAGLLEGLLAEHVEHRFNFLVEVEKLVVAVINLR